MQKKKCPAISTFVQNVGERNRERYTEIFRRWKDIQRYKKPQGFCGSENKALQAQYNYNFFL